MSAYLKVYAAGFTGIVLVALSNLVIDPYGIYNPYHWVGINAVKPAMQNHEKLVKAYLSTHLRPVAVALGTSRADFGIDPAHPAWGDASPRFNMALAGGDVYVTRRFLEHVLVAGRLRKVVFGLDFFAFNTILPSDHDNSMLAVRDDGTSNRNHLWNILVSSTFSQNAIKDSYKTINAHRDAAIQVINPVSGMRQFFIAGQHVDVRKSRMQIKVDAEQGAHKSFQVNEELYLKHVYLAGSNREYAFKNPHTGKSSLQEFRRIVQLCREHGIDTYFFISPTHARQIEVIRAIGLWPLFEQWKRELVVILAEENVDLSYPLWDFSGYNSVTTTDVPRDARMREYLDSAHYTPIVGDMMLARMLGPDTIDQPVDDFGVKLSMGNIEETLASIRQGQAAYHRSHPQDVREISALADRFGFDPKSIIFTGGDRPQMARSFQPPRK